MIIDSGGHGGTRLALIEFRFRDNSSKVLEIAVLKNTKNESGYGNFNDQYYVAYDSPGISRNCSSIKFKSSKSRFTFFNKRFIIGDYI